MIAGPILPNGIKRDSKVRVTAAATPLLNAGGYSKSLALVPIEIGVEAIDVCVS